MAVPWLHYPLRGHVSEDAAQGDACRQLHAHVAPQLTVQMDTMIDGTLTCSGQLSVADVMTAGGTGLDAVGAGLKHAHELAVASLWTTRTGCT